MYDCDFAREEIDISVLVDSFSEKCLLTDFHFVENDILVKDLSDLVRRLGAFTNLTSLHVVSGFVQFNLSSFLGLCQAVERPKMKDLNIEVSSRNLTLLSLALARSDIESLCVSYFVDYTPPIVLGDFDRFFNQLGQSLHLTKLRLDYFPNGPEGVKILSSLLPRLSSFHLIHVELDQESGKRIALALQTKGNRLRDLYLEHCSLNSKGAIPIFQALSNPNCLLTSLALRWNGLTWKVEDAAVKALRSPNCLLTKLGLLENYGQDFEDIYDTMAKVANWRNLIVLRSANEVTRWKRKASISKLPQELCQLVGRYILG
jgi:hypothetical protein